MQTHVFEHRGYEIVVRPEHTANRRYPGVAACL